VSIKILEEYDVSIFRVKLNWMRMSSAMAGSQIIKDLASTTCLGRNNRPCYQNGYQCSLFLDHKTGDRGLNSIFISYFLFAYSSYFHVKYCNIYVKNMYLYKNGM
jgi:hypothetical protein